MLTHDSVVYHEYFQARSTHIRKDMGLAVAVLCGLCAVPVLFLFFVQLGNMVIGKTTHERFAFKSGSKVGRMQGGAREVNGEEFETRTSISDSQSMMLSQSQNDVPFFAGTTLTAGALSRDRIKISYQKKCCGLCVEREVTMDDSQDMVVASS